MHDNVIDFKGVTRIDLMADRVVDAAKGKLKDAVIVGWDNDGEFYFASSKASGAEVIWLLEMAKKKLLEFGDA